MTRLVINADDFGISPAVNAGILEAHAAGSVTSTSMLVHCPGWDDAARLRDAAPRLGVGLHLNLLVGAPTIAGVTMIDRRTGRFLGLGALLRRALAGRLDSAEIEAECEAQIAAIEALGVTLTHIDSHRHTHALPVVRRAVARVAARRRLPLRRPVESHRWFPNDGLSQFHRGVIAWSWRVTSVGAAATLAPDHFIGVSMQGGDQFEAQITHLLDRLPSGSVELMVHPGRVDAALESVDGYTWQRTRELAALTSAPVLNRLRQDDIALIRFSEL
ncbi:carbohydrate deacetylase [Gemmatimonadota bacterium]|nr:carbohydrate deacetylase [Gemmatimonadota bacterium]